VEFNMTASPESQTAATGASPSAAQPRKILIPDYDTYREGHMRPTEYGVTLARSMEDMHKVIAIRSAAYFSDPEHTFGKHFDGNDFSSSHMIGYIGEEPVGTVRIRYFADFARVERIAVRPTHRKSRISFKLVQAAFSFCRDKGYLKVSGVAREEMMPFWSLFGARLTTTKEPVFIYGLPHTEMVVEYPPVETAITPDTDITTILRQEGRWHEPGTYRVLPGQAEPIVVATAKPIPKTTPRQLAERLAARKHPSMGNAGQHAAGEAGAAAVLAHAAPSARAPDADDADHKH
jgi:predicted GNAT family N-acyltransferase